MNLPYRVYPDLIADGQGISLSLKKIVNFFAGKVGTNTPQAASSSSSPIKLSSRMGKDINKPWSWGAATLAHLYYSLGALSRVNAKGLACCTTLLESWIFDHFPKQPGIPTPNQSGTAGFCTRWSPTKTTSAQSGSADLNMFKKSLDSYKLQDRQFNRRQPIPRATTCVEQSGLHLGDKQCAYKPKYNWVDFFSKGKWRDSIILTRGRKFHDGILVYTEGYFEWFNSVSFTKLCPDVVNLTEDDDYDDGRVLRDRGGVSQRKNTGECAFLIEANLRMQAEIQAKDVANSICEKKLNEKTLECESNMKLVEDLHMQLAGTIEGGDFEDTEDLTWEELSRQFTKLLAIAQEGPKGECKEPNEVLECEGFPVYLNDKETFLLEEHSVRGGHLYQQQGGLKVLTYVLAESKQQEYQREE
ncbi:hypothetical protein GIB67_038675, partial [Kingdonia uniflora]